MAQLHIFNRSLAAAGIVISLLAPQSASAFGHIGGFSGRGGMSHGAVRLGAPSGHHDFGGMHLADGHNFRRPSTRQPFVTHLPRQPTHIVGRYPGRFPPIRVVLPPRHPWPPIFIPPYHRGPHLPPSIIVEAPRVVPASVRVADIAPRVGTVRNDASVLSACGSEGSFISVVFVPTVTAADITAFLKAYNVTVADGPNTDGIYRIRLASNALPRNEVLKLIDSMRAQSTVVSSVDGA